jgi:hypothetical protein
MARKRNAPTRPPRYLTLPRQAQALGYYIRLVGDCGGVRAGRWYYGNVRHSDFFVAVGAGYRTQREAWLAALAHEVELQRTTFKG